MGSKFLFLNWFCEESKGKGHWEMESKGLGDKFVEVSSMSEIRKSRCTTMDLGILKGL
jgi:hypothetical protein